MLIQIITIIVVLYLLTRVGAKLKRKDITLKEAFLWGVLWLGVGIVVLYPSLADKIASYVGLQTATGIDLVVYLAVGLAFYLIFRLFVHIERIERDITKIIRQVALKDEHDK
ncbi:MAG: hypothetical protein CO042_01795 [Parcubacteria group bacterium CG_4_9_14_0_2_um_filter_41_8]|nr:MAG: hypothetical protein AUJ34_00165 [Parcubacteria group bacterium CG1_02_41_12]PIP66899.1 MAG: hypothetical protein COW93_03120 [Parcubacteria group bacterium CG22_combo_CG10-13_8_21_14_all_41_9]PJC40808.1 MAG: hypothetical protein CO042_01795 [Parcubacteria group bacterium CG_4_9_14_0_2_um_filter_41_8]